MNQYLNLAYEMRIFHLSEFMSKTGMSIVSASTMLNRWKKSGLVKQVRRNLYCMNNPVGNMPAAHKFEIACKVSDTSFLSYHSALEYHGIGHQAFNTVMISDKTVFRPFIFDDNDYQSFVSKIGMNGVICSNVNLNVRVTDIERTFVDCIDRIGRSGGAEELFHCFEGLYTLDMNKVKTYLTLYNKSHLYQKVGYVLEKLKGQINVPIELIEICRSKGKNSVKDFSRTENCNVFIKEWNLYVPNIIINNYDYELV